MAKQVVLNSRMAVLGCLAAAVASSVMLGLSADETATAVGLAATQAGGVRAMFGSHGKGIHAGRAASEWRLGCTPSSAAG